MPLLPYKLLAIDIDGTLVNSRDELTPKVRDALRAAAAAGLRLVLATGRRYSRALPLVEPLGIDAPIVSAWRVDQMPAESSHVARGESRPRTPTENTGRHRNSRP
ncbi:MAG: HAD-IIB family hydrolase [Pirellulales bacterium]